MHVVYAKASNRKMYLPNERLQIMDDGGLGFSFNIGKMFKRLTKITKTSFRGKNIMGAIGSGASNFFTFGAASAIAPKTFGAHSKTMQKVGMGVSAAAIAAGTVFTAGALLPAAGGLLGSTGGLLMSAGGGLLKLAPTVLSMFSKKGSGAPAPGSMQFVDPNTGRILEMTPQQMQQVGLSQSLLAQAGYVPVGRPGELTVSNEYLPGYGKKTIIPGISDSVTIGGGLALTILVIVAYTKKKRR